MVVIPTLCKNIRIFISAVDVCCDFVWPYIQDVAVAIMLVFELGDLIWDQKKLN